MNLAVQSGVLCLPLSLNKYPTFFQLTDIYGINMSLFGKISRGMILNIIVNILRLISAFFLARRFRFLD